MNIITAQYQLLQDDIARNQDIMHRYYGEIAEVNSRIEATRATLQVLYDRRRTFIMDHRDVITDEWVK